MYVYYNMAFSDGYGSNKSATLFNYLLNMNGFITLFKLIKVVPYYCIFILIIFYI